MIGLVAYCAGYLDGQRDMAVTARWDRVRAERVALALKQVKRKRGRAGVQTHVQ